MEEVEIDARVSKSHSGANSIVFQAVLKFDPDWYLVNRKISVASISDNRLKFAVRLYYSLRPETLSSRFGAVYREKLEFPHLHGTFVLKDESYQ